MQQLPSSSNPPPPLQQPNRFSKHVPTLPISLPAPQAADKAVDAAVDNKDKVVASVKTVSGRSIV